MNPFSLIAICALGALVAWRFTTSAPKGLALLAGLLVFLPHSIRLEMGGALPSLTIHRALLLAVYLRWLSMPPADSRMVEPGLRRLLWGVAGVLVLSLPFSTRFGPSFKQVLSFWIESVLFFVLLTKHLRTAAHLQKICTGVCWGLLATALNSFFERYGSGSWFSAVPGWGLMPSSMDGRAADIQSTYPHRILFGYAMAMGAMLAATLPWRRVGGWSAKLGPLTPFVLLSACYFSQSRGPWLGALVGAVVLLVMGTRRIRKRMMTVAALAVALMLLRPGVRETITTLFESTFETDTVKAKSYNYRWKLWEVAFSEVLRSPVRLLFGYGDGSTDFMDLSGHFGRQEGGAIDATGFTSWDNQYASDLIELGFLGAGLTYALYVAVALVGYRTCRRTFGLERELAAGLAAGLCIYLFAMSNVAMFSPQLTFLFWITAAAACVLGRSQPPPPTRESMPANRPEVTDAILEPPHA